METPAIALGGFSGRERHKLCLQLLGSFNKIEIQRNAIDRAYFAALRYIKMSDTLRAFQWINFVNFDAERNCLVGTLGLADIAIDALIGNL